MSKMELERERRMTLSELMKEEDDEGEVIKSRNGWYLTRENLNKEWWKKPKYLYRVYYIGDDDKFLSLQTFRYREALNHFNFQSKLEELKPKMKPKIPKSVKVV